MVFANCALTSVNYAVVKSEGRGLHATHRQGRGTASKGAGPGPRARTEREPGGFSARRALKTKQLRTRKSHQQGPDWR